MKRLATLFVLLGGCGSTPTEVVVVVTSDLDIPMQIDRIRIDAREGDDDAVSRVVDIASSSDLPITLGLVHDGGALGPIAVDVVGLRGETEVVRRQARFDFIRHRTLTVHLPLLRECLGVICGDDATCAIGGCRPIQIPPEELQPWQGNDDGGVACEPERCNGRDDDCDGRADEDWDLTRDLGNCGACGAVCSAGAGADSAECVGGACTQACRDGLGDCDGNVANGCETRVDTSDEHCGSCGASCERFRADTRCEAGRCEQLACDPGFRDCDLNPDSGCESSLTDNENCGGCGIPCSLFHAIESCGMGVCMLSSCDDGWDNCDGRVENGCEADVSADVFHCGGCGRRCDEDAPNAADVCADGRCEVACHPGWADCDGVLSNGCETDISDPMNCGTCGTRCTGVDFLCSGTPSAGYECIPPPCTDPPTRCGASCVDTESNPQHCGGCDVVCPGGPNAARLCAAAACMLDCDPGYGDCDGEPANGCEEPLNSAESCGACGRTCELPGAIAACLGVTCIVAGCEPGFDDCNVEPADGCETPITSLTSCGACGVSCSRPNATADCGSGACRIGFCDVGWGDCDGVDANGCETPLTGCDTCSGRCLLDNATGECVSDACRIASCAPGWGDCDGAVSSGCETSLDSLDDCGVCGAACVTPNASPLCVGGACVVDTCDPGWGDCDADPTTGCEADLGSGLHCGTCGNSCASAEVCFAGACTAGNDFVQVDAGHQHTCAIDAVGLAYCWGEGSDGRLGQGEWADSAVPVRVDGVGDAIHIAAGNTSSCLVRTGGRVVCWGANFFGQLGAGGLFENSPVSNGISDALRVAVGNDFACALRAGGRVSCWGQNNWGQVGDGSTSPRRAPFELALSSVAFLDTGADHTCVVRTTGELLCWGKNQYGELGDGTTDPRVVPTPVTSLDDVVEVAGGSDHTCALLGDKSLWCWGRNGAGQIGDGSTTDRLLPVSVMSNVLDLATGLAHSCATQADSVSCWGKNDTGQVGDGSLVDRHVPTLVPGLGASTSLEVGTGHSCAVDATRVLACWGANDAGQLGDGSSVMLSSVPAVVATGS